MFSGSALNRPFVARLLTAILLGAVLSGCSQEKVETKETIRPVKVVEIAAAGEPRELHYSGSVRARTEMNLGFRVGGKITERLVNIGDRVKPGDILARIDATDYRLAVTSAEANLLAAKSRCRRRRLRNSGPNSSSPNRFPPRLSSIRQRSLRSSGIDARRRGLVAEPGEEPGKLYGPQGRSERHRHGRKRRYRPGRRHRNAVVTVAVDGEKEVEIAVPEIDVAEFKPGKPVGVRFWSNDMLVLDGHVREVSGSADQRSRTFSVRVSLPNDERVLLGMTATVEAAAASSAPLVSIPLSALSKKDGQNIVWIVDRDFSTVHARPIKLADFADNGVRVVDGLGAGDLVVAAGTQFMAEDLKVKLQAGEQQSAEQQSARAETPEILR